MSVARTKRPFPLRSLWLIAASALIALAAWPAYLAWSERTDTSDPAAQLTPAPVKADYLGRDQTIGVLERDVARDSGDQITSRMLSGEYMQRYRERGDVGDILRAEHAARASLKAQLYGNIAGDAALTTALLALHRFHEARRPLGDARLYVGANPGFLMNDAGLSLELGEYPRAESLLARVGPINDPAVQITRSRYDEESGKLAEARTLLERAMRQADSIYDTPAERRAWFHFRMGELAFLAGDNDGAIAAERAAIAIFPDDFLAYNALARDLAANHRWDEAEAAAQRGVTLMPSPETFGYLADAQAARGETAAAAATRDEIVAIERIGNAQHLSDRLLAVYYADHGLRLDDAYAIAHRELSVRDDIYTEDTLAWTAAKDEKWDVARAAERKAIRFDTEDPRMQYHAGFIALHFGDRAEAKARFTRALALNPHFHPTQADDARRELALL